MIERQDSDGLSVPEKTALPQGLGPDNTPPHSWLAQRCNLSPAGWLPVGTGNVLECRPRCPSAMTGIPG